MPRLFTREDATAAAASLDSRYAAHLGAERFEVGGRVEPGFVELTAVLANSDKTFRYEIEVRAAVGGKGVSQVEGRELVLDFLGYYLDQYFDGGRDVLLPLDFQPYQFGEHTVHARGDVTNPALDEVANRILEDGVPLAPDDPRHRLKVSRH